MLDSQGSPRDIITGISSVWRGISLRHILRALVASSASPSTFSTGGSSRGGGSEDILGLARVKRSEQTVYHARRLYMALSPERAVKLLKQMSFRKLACSCTAVINKALRATFASRNRCERACQQSGERRAVSKLAYSAPKAKQAGKGTPAKGEGEGGFHRAPALAST